MKTLIFYFLFSHIISFLCSILEAVLLSCTNPYIASMKKKNPPVGKLLESLKMRIDRPLAAILTFNTSAHTFGAAGVGAKVVELFGNYWLGICSIIVTLTMLFFTEMIPKTLGALYWRKLAPFSAYCIKVLIIITYPFVISFEHFARALAKGSPVNKVTEEDIKHILVEGTEAGVIQEAEHEMLESIFRLGSRRVGVLMTTRKNISWLDLQEPLEQTKKQIEDSSFSRFPVCDGDLDNFIGIVGSKAVLQQILETGSFDLRSLAQPSLFVPENMRVLQLVDLFKKTPDHIALVTDEYGCIQGLVTFHDVLESIVGDVPTSALATTSQIVRRTDGSWLVEGSIPIDEFKEYFKVDYLPNEDKGVYRTIGGFCMQQLGNIPRVGDLFSWNNMKIKIVKMDERRVEKILITYFN